MSADLPRTGSTGNGIYVSNRELYDMVQLLAMEVTRFKTWFAVIGFVVAPIVSTLAASIAMSLINGGN